MSQNDCIKVAVMGGTGTGKSTFIQHLTNDTNIRIGHDTESETSEIYTAYYTDEITGRSVMLIDTPGFDDSRDGITDTDILQMLINFLQPENGEGERLNGIIYMHRISDTRVGGLAKKNIRMFRALCGEKNLRNVRVVTTNWDRAAEQEGAKREEQLRKSAFELLLTSGAQMRRHSNDVHSAQAIMAELIALTAVSTQLQDQVVEGMRLGETDAGRIINQDVEELIKKRTKELAKLDVEIEDATRECDKAFQGELLDERTVLEEKIRRAEEDLARLRMTLDTLRMEKKAAQEESKDVKAWFDKLIAKLRLDHDKVQEDVQQLRTQVDHAKKQRGNAVEGRRGHREMERIVGESEQEAARLQQQIEEIEAQKHKADNYANRGMLSRFLRDIGWTDFKLEEGNRRTEPIGGFKLVGGLVEGATKKWNEWQQRVNRRWQYYGNGS